MKAILFVILNVSVCFPGGGAVGVQIFIPGEVWRTNERKNSRIAIACHAPPPRNTRLNFTLLCDSVITSKLINGWSQNFVQSVDFRIPVWNFVLYALYFLYYICIFWGGTRSLRMPTLRPASQAGPMRNPREGTSVV